MNLSIESFVHEIIASILPSRPRPNGSMTQWFSDAILSSLNPRHLLPNSY